SHCCFRVCAALEAPVKEISRFGPFAFEGQLGSTPGGSVYRAIHVAQRRMVAVKLFAAPLVAKSNAAKQALVREMDVLTKLKHWNLVACHGGILEDMQGCVVYEFVEGETLKDLLARRDRLAWETVADYAYQIIAGLECAHSQNVVHQDLHPDKVLIAEDGTVKIADLRVDRARNPWCTSSTRLTIERAAYRAPEQLAGSQELTHKTDLYALGCIMFEMLVGRPPFEGDSIEAIVKQHQEEMAPRVDGILFECPVWLADVVAQLLEKDPAQRPSGAAAVSFALSETTRQAMSESAPITSGPYGTLRVEREQDVTLELLEETQRPTRKSTRSVELPPFYERAWFLALSLLMLIGGISTWLLWPPSEAGLLRRAVAIIESKEGIEREKARPYLEKQLRMYPRGELADAAEEHLKLLDMDSAMRKFEFNVKYAREPKSEAERLYKEAWDFEQFGDRLAALEKYRSMVNVLSDGDEDATRLAFVNLARRNIAEIEAKGSDDDRLDFIESRLQDAEQLSSQGKELDAKKVWRGIVELYGNKPEFQTLVERAETRLHPSTEATATDS
ncbi:MAG TPA: serine/threonine-protein kinase, partial [Pirellulaceae bacterium]|nr:serine/threonine-protein kinase [Pirellulaceae bacterium]